MKQNVRFLELYYEHTQVGELCKSELLEVIRIDILSAPIQRTECCQNCLYSRTFTVGQLSTTAPVFCFLDSGQCFVSIPFLGAADGSYVHSLIPLHATITSPQRHSKLLPHDTAFFGLSLYLCAVNRMSCTNSAAPGGQSTFIGETYRLFLFEHMSMLSLAKRVQSVYKHLHTCQHSYVSLCNAPDTLNSDNLPPEYCFKEYLTQLDRNKQYL